MNITSDIFTVIDDPIASMADLSPAEWLKEISQPICILIKGKDQSRTRVISTLLHGNEPSGYYALFNWIREKKQPAVNAVFFISAYEASLREPHFFHRTKVSGVDLNRVFMPPYETEEGRLAEEMLRIIRELKPEGLVDVHNTSGSSPEFCVVCKNSDINQKIASLFTKEFIIFDLKLNTLVEALSDEMPAIVIECGGAEDPDSIYHAQKGIDRFLAIDDLYTIDQNTLTIRDNPIRVKLKPNKRLDYYESYIENFDLVMPDDADKYNSMAIEKDAFIAWVGPSGLDVFECVNLSRGETLSDYFYVAQNHLRAKRNLRLYMVTTKLEIALTDCLFYLLKSS